MAKRYENYTKEQLIEKIKQLEKHRYGLVWEDKLEDVAEQCERELPVLTEDTSKQIITNDKLPNNILIEGDNYHALYALNFTHKRKVDVIYIDPPYNTGNRDFKYNDHFVDREDSFRHSKWLSFMNKRLRLAKNLLKDTGVIFISIDDNEVSQLRMICDKIFNEMNFIATIIWEKKFSPQNDAKWFSDNHDFILLYAKSKHMWRPNLVGRNEKQLSRYKNPDNDHRGVWASSGLDVKTYSAEYDYEITTPSGRKVKPPVSTCWRFSKERLKELISENRIWFGENGNNVPRLKRFLNEVKEGITPLTIWKHEEVGHTQEATQELKKFALGDFTSPKPVRLITKILKVATTEDSIVLDFFAGSGTTGQAVIELNQQDGGNRQFILCTNNENKICEEVTYPRIKRVIEGYSGTKEIPANLKYFKTDFVPQVITDNDKRILVNRSTELLCIAENTFELVKQSKRKLEFAIYKSDKQFTAVIYDEDLIEKCKTELEALKPKTKTIIYVFSYNHEYSTEDFENLTIRFDVKPIPEAILNVYRKNAKLKSR